VDGGKAGAAWLSGTLVLITNPTKEAHPGSMQFSRDGAVVKRCCIICWTREKRTHTIFCKSREFYVAFLTGKLSFDVE
jgi:flavin reductase (DIM6/NTAB) family NADH-FMN oxidoreductase RutF